MELMNKQSSGPSQSWTERVERRHAPKADYCSELKSWLQRAILEAEKKRDFHKKHQLLSLLEEL